MRNQLNNTIGFFLLLLVFAACQPTAEETSATTNEDGWVELFNGKDLTGWRPSEHKETFSVQDGTIMAFGDRSHLYYEGEHLGEGFKNFEIEMDIKTHRLANSGIFYHTEYLEEGWPGKGREVQVNNTHPGVDEFKELKKTGSLYGIRNLFKAFAQDSVWFRMRFVVQDKQIRVWVNDVNTVNYTEPLNPPNSGPNARATFSSGTIALQGHDAKSKVMYKNIRLRRLPDTIKVAQQEYQFGDWHPKMLEKQSNQYPFIDLNAKAETEAEFQALLEFYYTSGVNIGLVVPADSLTAWKTKHENTPIFWGTEAGASADVVNQADYTVGTVPMPEFTEGNPAERYMATYIAQIMEFLENGSADVWAKATQLPDALSDQYDALWAPEAIKPVLALAAEKGIAIEIDNQAHLPSMEVIKLAKEAGCLFSYTGIASDAGNNDSQYFLDVIDSCELDYKSMYVPLWE